ncbi:MAG: hypothetical protein RI554_03710, partial [Trueperaceae bacterium]|nr:hypothetical protein [Trueperaceae bacterium]
SDAAASDGGDAPAPVQPGLFAGGPARPDAPRPRAPRSPRPPTRAVRDPGRGAPPPVTVDDLADPRDVGWSAGPQASAGVTAGVGTTASAPSVAAPVSPADAADVDADVRARVDRWLRDPRTPVLVRLDRLRDACELDDATTRRVVDALLATPPDGLVLEAIAPGYVRVARERPRRSGA